MPRRDAAPARSSPSGSAGGPPAPQRGWHNRGYLPHFDAAVVQMITYRLADSLPRDVADAIRLSSTASYRRLQALLDAGNGTCVLGRPEVAAIVVDNWLHFDGVRYRLHAWVVMPNHVHLLAEVDEGASLSRIVHGWKSYTAHRIRRLCPGEGRVWHPDYWDRFVRDDEHFVAAIEYIEDNPVRAGLASAPNQWPWSSAGALRGGRAARGPG